MVFMIAMGASLLIGGSLQLRDAVYIGLMGFIGWSCTDAVNNICDVEIDRESDALRSEFTAGLGIAGPVLAVLLGSVAVGMGLLSGRIPVAALVVLGLGFGVAYSVPPVRLRQTIFKPLVNSAVGVVPVLIAAAFHDSFTVEAFTLAVFMGVATAVNSLWEDLADYSSDLMGRAETFLVVLGFRRGLHATIVLGYSLVPLMVLIGLMFRLGVMYYCVFSVLVAFMSLHIIQERRIILGRDTEAMRRMSPRLARDFAIIAVAQTTNFMLAGFLKGL